MTVQGSGPMERSFCFLFADLAGFTALTEAHGDLDAADIACRFAELARGVLCGSAHTVKTIGDAVMIVSDGPEDAIATALRIRRATEAELRFPDVRLGLAAGPAVERAGDYFGATVNLAARVTAHARAGQILCTEAVADACRAMPDAEAVAAGQARFKNVAGAVSIYEVLDRRSSRAPGATDPVCRMAVDPATAAARLTRGDETYYFCSEACARMFAERDP